MYLMKMLYFDWLEEIRGLGDDFLNGIETLVDYLLIG